MLTYDVYSLRTGNILFQSVFPLGRGNGYGCGLCNILKSLDLTVICWIGLWVNTNIKTFSSIRLFPLNGIQDGSSYLTVSKNV